MQGLQLRCLLAALISWFPSLCAAGQPLVADVTVHRFGEPAVLVGGAGLEQSELLIRAPGATFLKLHFSDFDLPRGVVVEVSHPAGVESYRYSLDSRDPLTFDPHIGDDGRRAFSAMSISGDIAQVRVVGRTDRIEAGRHVLIIDHYLEGLASRPAGQVEGSAPQFRSPCGLDERPDAVCWADSHPGEYDRARPVGKVLTTTGIVCTAWRVGPQNRLFTAEHCIANQADVSAAEVWFNYQSADCGGETLNAATKASGKNLLAVNETLDFALFSVNDFGTIEEFGYLGLEVREGVLGEEIYIPQHGFGDPKQLALESDMNASGLCQIDDDRHDGFGSETDLGYFCDTVASSSGSPVIASASGRAIALHHLGGCVNSGAKMSLIWPLVAAHFGNEVPPGDDEVGADNQSPIAAIGFACDGPSCNFSGNGSDDPDGSIVSFQWSFGDGGTASGAAVSYVYPLLGTYQVTLTVTDNEGATGVASQDVSLVLPVSPLTAAFQVRCKDLLCVFDPSPSQGRISRHEWSFGDGSTARHRSPYHRYRRAGRYQVSLTVSDRNGAADTLQKTITVGQVTRR